MKMKTLRLRVSERSSQKFKLYVVSEVTVTLQDAFPSEVNEI